MTDFAYTTNKNKNKNIPLNNEEQKNSGVLNTQEWPTPAETKPKRRREATRLKIEGSCRTAPSFKKKGTAPYRKEGARKTTLAKGMTPKVLVKRVEYYEGLGNIVSWKEDGKKAEPSPGTSGAAEAEPIPTGAVLPGIYGAAMATPLPTEEVPLGTNGAVGTASFPTGETAGIGRGEGEASSASIYALPPTQDGGSTAEEPLEKDYEGDKTVIMSSDEEEEVVIEEKKNKVGRRPTTGKGVGLRQKREAKEKARKEREQEEGEAMILDPTIPKGRRWESFREREEELRKELSNAPSLDLRARVMESTARMFKAADCSSKMKGNIVKVLKEAAASTRAVMLILAERVRETERVPGPTERERYLEAQIDELKRKVEELERRPSIPPASPTTSPPRERIATKRRRVAIESEEEVDAPAPAPSTSSTARSPPPQETTRGYEGKEEEKASRNSGRYCDGPSLKGVIRRVEAYPLGIKPQDRAQYDALAKQRAELAGQQNVVSVDSTRVTEYIAIGAQMQQVAAQMDALRMSEEGNPPRSIPHSARIQGEKGTKVPTPREVERMEGVEVTPSPVLTAQRKKNKKKKKKKKRNTASSNLGASSGNTGSPNVGAPSGNIGSPNVEAPAGNTGSPNVGAPSGNAGSPSVGAPSATGPNRGRRMPTTEGKRILTRNARDAQPPSHQGGEAWSQVVGRRARTQGKTGGGNVQGTSPPTAKPRGPGQGRDQGQVQTRTSPSTTTPSQEGRKKQGKRKPPRTAAVVITCPLGGYKEVLREAVDKIDLTSLNIGGMTARKAVTGAHIYEIGGPDKEVKADALAAKLRDLVGQREGVRVSRPSMTAEIRLRGLDESVVPADIARAVAACGGCSPDEVKAGEVQIVGRGPGTAWVRCPIAAANKAVAAKAIQIGWIKARVEALERRPLQCFKCLKKGHTIAQCNGPDRSNLCYRCGRPGHAARECRAPERCPICADLGRAAAHRAGSKLCASPKAGKKKGGNKQPSHPPARNLPQEGGSQGPRKEGASPLPATNSGEAEASKPQRQRRERNLSQQPPNKEAEKMEVD